MAIELQAVLNLQDNVSGPLKSLNGQLASFVGFAAVAAGATAAVKTFATFDTSIRQAATIAGASSTELVEMGEAAKKMGAETSLSASEVATAMSELAAKGYDASKTIAAMPGIIAGAEASGEDLALVADTVATAINIWGMEAGEAGKVSDILAMTANKTAAGVADMQYALKYAGAPAKALGMSLEEVAAAAGLLVDAGLDGSSAGTALRQGLTQLVSPSKAAQKTLDAVGFSATDAKGNMKSMEEIVASLKGGLEGMSEAERVTSMKQWVGTESMSAFLALVDAGPDKLGALQTELENSEGAAQAAADQMKAGIGGALEQAGGAIETFAIEVGAALAPAVTEFANFIASADTGAIVEAMKDLGGHIQTVANLITENWKPISDVVMAVVGAFVAFKLIMMGMTVIGAITALISAYRTAVVGTTAVQLALNLAMSANPIGAVILAISALVGVGILLWRNWDKVKAKTLSMWEGIKQGKGAIFLVLGPLGQIIKTAIDLAKNWDSSKSVWENVWGAMKRSAADTVNSVIEGINSMINMINKIPGVNIPIVAKVDWGTEGSVANQVYTPKVANTAGGTAHALGNHAGLGEVHGTTIRKLHDGERVLTAVENKALKQQTREANNAEAQTPIGNKTIAPVMNFAAGSFVVREEADVEKIAGALADKIARYA